ncbi:dTMP kinase [Candidatus Poribacteria bacterium]
MLNRGMFISLEGVEGCGKSIQAELLAEHVAKLGHSVIRTHEPGGTPIAEQIREILLDPRNSDMAHIAELLLYLASRAQHVFQLILPALNEGKIVICERFSDATFAYQGYARGLDLDHLKQVNDIATGGLEPDLTLILDLDAADGLSRKQHDQRDRLENESVDFHNRVREAYLVIARQSPDRVQVIDATGSIEDIHLSIRECVDQSLAVHSS